MKNVICKDCSYYTPNIKRRNSLYVNNGVCNRHKVMKAEKDTCRDYNDKKFLYRREKA